jgi:hypothetical protein
LSSSAWFEPQCRERRFVLNKVDVIVAHSDAPHIHALLFLGHEARSKDAVGTIQEVSVLIPDERFTSKREHLGMISDSYDPIGTKKLNHPPTNGEVNVPAVKIERRRQPPTSRGE